MECVRLIRWETSINLEFRRRVSTIIDLEERFLIAAAVNLESKRISVGSLYITNAVGDYL